MEMVASLMEWSFGYEPPPLNTIPALLAVRLKSRRARTNLRPRTYARATAPPRFLPQLGQSLATRFADHAHQFVALRKARRPGFSRRYVNVVLGTN